MSETDPHYAPASSSAGERRNPFLALPLLTQGQKIFNDADEVENSKLDVAKQSADKFLFSSCFELTPDMDSSRFTFNVPNDAVDSKLEHGPQQNARSGVIKLSHGATAQSKSSLSQTRRISLPNTPELKHKSVVYIAGPATSQNSSCSTMENNIIPSSPIKITNENDDGENMSFTPNSDLSELATDALLPLKQSTKKSKEKKITTNEEEDIATRELDLDEEDPERNKRSITSANMTRYFEDQMFQGRVQLLRRLYAGGGWVTQDDSALELSSFSSISTSTSAGGAEARAENIFNLPPETGMYVRDDSISKALILILLGLIK